MGNVVLVCLSFLVLLVLSAIAIRSNLISSTSLSQQPQDSTTPAASSNSHSAPSSRAGTGMRLSQHVPDEEIGSDNSQNANPAQSHDAELAKWKAVELFKVQIVRILLPS